MEAGRVEAHRELESHLSVARPLTLAQRLLFWSTNLPYWALLAAVCLRGARPAMGPAPVHCVAAFAVALSSSLFHMVQLRLGGPLCGRCCPTACLKHLGTPACLTRLIVADVSCAAGYGACLLAWDAASVKWLLPPLLFLFGGAFLRRQGQAVAYAVAHGLWHLLSAAALAKVVLLGTFEV
ncbi:unnamed protein product [Prorocentrum cordatum]|uniref:Alkaline ceramidase n=1 Tax=Prorocentrum cordatum TaxID=2364126 RepID=A0ABN9UAD9_9DINO|nr:unnamed protein product [Polarella glacialis]